MGTGKRVQIQKLKMLKLMNFYHSTLKEEKQLKLPKFREEKLSNPFFYHVTMIENVINKP